MRTLTRILLLLGAGMLSGCSVCFVCSFGPRDETVLDQMGGLVYLYEVRHGHFPVGGSRELATALRGDPVVSEALEDLAVEVDDAGYLSRHGVMPFLYQCPPTEPCDEGFDLKLRPFAGPPITYRWRLSSDAR